MLLIIKSEENSIVVYTESFCQPEIMLKMLEKLLAFHAWYKKGHLFV